MGKHKKPVEGHIRHRFKQLAPKTRVCQSCFSTYGAAYGIVRRHTKYCPECVAKMENQAQNAWKFI